MAEPGVDYYACMCLKDGEYNSASFYFDKVIAQRPNDYYAHYNKAMCLKNLKKYQEAIKCYDQVLSLEPDYQDAHFDKGDCLRAIEKLEEAIKCYNQVIALNPKHHRAYIQKASCLDAIGMIEEAIECYEKAILLKPDVKDAFSGKGNCLNKLGKYQEAIEALDKALSLSPNEPKIYLIKGNNFVGLGKYQEAIEAYDKVIALDRRFEDAYYQKGKALKALNKIEEAIECYNQAISSSGYLDSYVEKAKFLNEIGKYQEAIEILDKTLAEDPEYALVHMTKGISLHLTDKHQDAIKCFEKAIELESKYFLHYCNLGKVLQFTGKSQEAFEKFMKAKYLLETERSYLSLAEKKFWKKTLENVININIVLEQANELLQQKGDKKSSKLGKLQSTISKFQEKRIQVINKISFEEKSSALPIPNINELDELLEEVEKELNNNLMTSYKKLASNLNKGGRSKEEIQKINNYFYGFFDTFNCVYNTSKNVENGQVSFNTGNDISTFLTTIASFPPYFEDGSSKIEEFLVNKQFKNQAKTILNLASDSSNMTQIAGGVCCNILLNQQVQKFILESSEKNINLEFDNRMQNLRNFRNKFGERFDPYLYNARYRTAERKLGNNDAIILLKGWFVESDVKTDIKTVLAEKIIRIYERNDEVRSPSTADQGSANNNMKARQGKSAHCNIF